MKNSRAYIIDDEEDICLLLQANLSKKFKEVHYSLSLKQGIAFLKKNEVHILFLDNNLPDGSGIEHITEIRTHHPKTIIIVISAMTNLRDKALDKGASEFLAKPISFKNISDLLTRFFPS